MEALNMSCLSSGAVASEAGLDEAGRLSGISQMMIGTSASSQVVQHADMMGILGNSSSTSGASTRSTSSTPATTSSVDCTLKCSVTLAVPSQGASFLLPSNAHHRVVQAAEEQKMFQSRMEDKDDDYEDGDEDEDEDDLEADSENRVTISEIIDKLQANASAVYVNNNNNCLSSSSSNNNNVIQLHAASVSKPSAAGDDEDDDKNDSPTISATVNVAALDLSDPDSIYHHLSQLNDTVLRVSAEHADDDLSEGGRDTPPIGRGQPAGSDQSSNMLSSVEFSSTKTSLNGSCINTTCVQRNISNESHKTFLPGAIQFPTSPLALAAPFHGKTGASPSLISNSSGSNSLASTPGDLVPVSPSAVTSVKQNSGSSKSTPQSCAICLKAFSNASALAKHRLTHSEERRYHCSICSKAFKRQDHLNGHLLTHRSTKPFACHIDGCGKSYCDARSLRRHKENHHGTNGNNGSALKQQMPQLPTLPIQPNTSAPAITLMAKEETTMLASSESSPMISRTSLGDTKIMFSSKGLTAQQLQIIEQLLKESRNGKIVSLPQSPSLPVMPTQPPLPQTQLVQQQLHLGSLTFPMTAGPSSSCPTTVVVTPRIFTSEPKNVVVEKSPPVTMVTASDNKPVECTICCRKFKNVPALNGHMRLHGGYYKKDVDGKRIPTSGSGQGNLSKPSNKFKTNLASKKKSQASTSLKNMVMASNIGKKTTTTTLLNLSMLQPVTPATLMASSSTSAAMLSSPTLSSSSASSPCSSAPSTPSVSPMSCLSMKPSFQVPSIPLCHSDSGHGSNSSLSFQSLPPPDTNQLLQNLEKKTFGGKKSSPKQKNIPLNKSPEGFGTIKNRRTSIGTSISGITTSGPLMQEDVIKDGGIITPGSGFGLQVISLPTQPIPQVQLQEPTSTGSNNKPIKKESNPSFHPMEISAPLAQPLDGQFTGMHEINEFMATGEMQTQVKNDPGMIQMRDLPSPFSQLVAGHPECSTPPPVIVPAAVKLPHHMRVDDTSDHTPKVGPDYQAEIPNVFIKTEDMEVDMLDEQDFLLWDPETADDQSLEEYLMLASSSALHLGSHNEELALEVLQNHDGCIPEAVADLLRRQSPDEDDEDDDDFYELMNDLGGFNVGQQRRLTKSTRKPWTEAEVAGFYESLVKFRKDFSAMSRHIGSRSTSECVEFFYLWKNFCPDEASSFKNVFSANNGVPANPADSATCKTTTTTTTTTANAS